MSVSRLSATLLVGFSLALARLPATGWTSTIHPNARKTYSAIMMWHDVVPKKKEVWFDVTVKELEDQFAEIKRRKFNVIALDQLFEHLITGAPLPSRPIVLTFDDTTKGIYTYAFPLLKRYRYPATLFVHTDYVGVKTGKDHCSWDDLKEMQASGLVDVQSHTASHPPDMKNLNDTKLRRELQASRQAIQQHVGRAAWALAYTEGGHDARIRAAVARAGYRIAIGEDWGSAGASKDLMQVYRYSVHRRWKQALDDVDQAYRRRSGAVDKNPKKGAKRS